MEKFQDIVHHHLKINHEILCGDITVKEIVEHRWNMMTQQGYDDSYKILVDVRKANFINFINDLPVFIDFVKKASACFNLNRKCAFITSTPEHVVYSEILKLGLAKIENSYIIGVFSTETAAMNWLLI
jgi:hypothetical protein